jgi:uncharacterized protein YjbJ (UPF0337 family)
MTDQHADERAKATLEDAKGKIKEKTGEVTDNERLEREGRRDQVDSNVKEGAKDAMDD